MWLLTYGPIFCPFHIDTYLRVVTLYASKDTFRVKSVLYDFVSIYFTPNADPRETKGQWSPHVDSIKVKFYYYYCTYFIVSFYIKNFILRALLICRKTILTTVVTVGLSGFNVFDKGRYPHLSTSMCCTGNGYKWFVFVKLFQLFIIYLPCSKFTRYFSGFRTKSFFSLPIKNIDLIEDVGGTP